LRNRASRRDLKSHLKTVADTAKGAAGDALKKEVSTAFRKLDQAAAKGVLHRNAAARKKAQLHRLLKSKAAT
jgi:small subunit ribosomal protein S20